MNLDPEDNRREEWGPRSKAARKAIVNAGLLVPAAHSIQYGVVGERCPPPAPEVRFVCACGALTPVQK